MSRNNRDIGKLGERMAEKFLASRGFRIMERNFSTPFGEIDLIVKQADFTVFVEVKTRISERFGSPLSSITKEKQKHILKNCNFYLKRHSLYEKPCRIDAISVMLNEKQELMILKYLRNAIVIKE